MEDLGAISVISGNAEQPRLIEITDVSLVIGRRLRYDVVRKEPILWTDLGDVAPANAPSVDQPSAVL
jgi:hypothetical protein